MSRRRTAGFSLPELMVALTIGLFLLAAFIRVLDQCRRESAANASLAGLQDDARQALDVLVFDLEHAGFLGFGGAAAHRLTRGGLVIAEGDALRQPDAAHTPAPVAGLPAGIHDCGVNFALDLDLPVQGSNNSWPADRDCAPTATAGGARTGTDTLTVRRASLEISKPHAGRLQLFSRPLESHATAVLFADGQAPGTLDASSELRDVEVRSYYIANNSVARTGWPALRVKELTEARGAAQFRDEEVIPGVEDLQVEFGLRDAGGTGSTLSFVAPDFPNLREHHIVAVRLWLRIRADQNEPGYADARPLHYADVSFVPNAAEIGQRRVLIARTVALRNGPVP